MGDSHHAFARVGNPLVVGTVRASAEEDNPLEEGTKVDTVHAEEVGTIHAEEVGTAPVGSLEAGIGLVVVGNGLEVEGIGPVGSLRGVDINLEGNQEEDIGQAGSVPEGGDLHV